MVHQDQELVRRDARMLGRGAEKEVGIAYDELVEGLARAHQHAERGAVAAPCPAEPLPGAGDGPGIAVQDADIERPDIHPQLERRCRDHAIHSPGTQLPLRRPALGRQVAAAIGEHPCGFPPIAVEDVLHVLGDDFDHEPRIREDDGLQPRLDRQARDARRLRTGRCAQPEVGIQHRRVPEQQMLLPLRRAAFRDGGNCFADQLLRQFVRVRDGGGAEHEGRAHAVEGAHALEPPDHVRQMRAEHASVGMHLVDDDVVQVLEELRPLGVVGQDAYVQHVGIRDDDIALGAHRDPRIPGRITIERIGTHAEVAGFVQLQDLGHLILGQRLRGKEVERLRLRLERRL